MGDAVSIRGFSGYPSFIVVHTGLAEAATIKSRLGAPN